MSDVAIRVSGLGKQYRLRHENGSTVGSRTLREDLVTLPGRLLRGFGNRRVAREDFWALKDVSFEVYRGEVLGVIGRNGAGKSTLLKILSRVVEPTEGEAEVFGRVGSLLEVGTGFHPELTGRENIFLSGALLGMRRSEIRRRFDEIVAFAEVDKFLDTPCKHYSSGMYTRLGFVVAAHLDAEILIVDEVLAVGDAEFQRKCLGKMSEVAGDGRAVLLVTHHLNVVSRLADSVLLLNEGRSVLRGKPGDAIAAYSLTGESTTKNGNKTGDTIGCSEIRGHGIEIQRIDLTDRTGCSREVFLCDEPIRMQIDYEIKETLPDFRIVVQFTRNLGEVAFATTDHVLRKKGIVESGRYRSSFEVPGNLLNLGPYSVEFGVGIPGVKRLITSRVVARVTIDGSGNHGSDFGDSRRWPGVVCPRLQWNVERL